MGSAWEKPSKTVSQKERGRFAVGVIGVGKAGSIGRFGAVSIGDCAGVVTREVMIKECVVSRVSRRANWWCESGGCGITGYEWVEVEGEVVGLSRAEARGGVRDVKAVGLIYGYST